MALKKTNLAIANDERPSHLTTVIDNRPVGEILRDARNGRNQDIAFVSEQLRIRRVFIEAIEESRLADLPGLPYAMGFIRAYSDHLGLDAGKMVEKFKQEASDLNARTELVLPEPIAAGRTPTGPVVFLSILLLAAGYGGWLYLSNKDRDTVELVPPLPASIAAFLNIETNQGEGTEPSQTISPVGTNQREGVNQEVNAQPGVTTPSVEETAPDSVADTLPAPAPAPAPAPVAENAAEPTTPELSVRPPALDTTPASAETPGEVVSVNAASSVSETQLQRVAEPLPAPAPLTPAPLTPAPLSDVRESSVVESVSETGSVNRVIVTVADPAGSQISTGATAEAIVDAQENAVIGLNSASAPGSISVGDSALQQETETVASASSLSSDALQPMSEPTGFASTPQETLNVPALPEAPEPSVFGEENSDARVVITAKSPAWVEITAPSGDVLLTRLLRTGDQFRVPNMPGLVLVTGNAGGLEFRVDGDAVPQIGPIGAVRRDVSLDPESLMRSEASAN